MAASAIARGENHRRKDYRGDSPPRHAGGVRGDLQIVRQTLPRSGRQDQPDDRADGCVDVIAERSVTES